MPTMISAIPQLPSGDLERSRTFLRDCLGFDRFNLYQSQGHLIACRDQIEIHYWLAGSDNDAIRLGATSSCYIRVSGIEDLYRELKGRGALFRFDLCLKPWGMLEMQVDDPWGCAIRFGEEVNRREP